MSTEPIKERGSTVKTHNGEDGSSSCFRSLPVKTLTGDGGRDQRFRSEGGIDG